MITDTNNNLVTFYQIILREGEESNPETFRVVPETVTDKLKAGLGANVSLWGKIGGGAYQNLYTTPLDVSAYFGTFVDVQVKAIAAEEVAGLVREYIFLGTARGSAAGWLL